MISKEKYLSVISNETVKTKIKDRMYTETGGGHPAERKKIVCKCIISMHSGNGSMPDTGGGRCK